MYLASHEAMAQDYNLVGTCVVQHPHKILAMLVRYHHSQYRSSCSETTWSQQFEDNLEGKSLLRISSHNNAEVIQEKRGAHGDWGHLWM